jgi:peptidoglycan/LPS O-acetylase OafA/YrhL
MKRDQIIGLDLIRFAAAMMVALYHLTYQISAPISTAGRIAAGRFEFPKVMAFGWVGVEVFFVLSGFVIAYSAASASAFSFLRSRATRLLPAAWICASVTLVVAFLVHDGSTANLLARYARSVLFIPIGAQIDGSYWTLAVEVAFYSLVFVLLCISRFNWLEWAMGAIALASAALWIGWAFSPDTFEPITEMRMGRLLLLRHGVFFGLGVMFWLIFMKGPTVYRYLISAICLGAGCIEIAAHDRSADTVLIANLVWLASVAAIIASVVWNDRVLKLVGRHAPLVRTLGVATYPLYLIHDLVGVALMNTLRQAGLSQWACLAVTIAAACAFAMGVATWLERPIGTAIKNVMSGAKVRVKTTIGRLAGNPASALLAVLG